MDPQQTLNEAKYYLRKSGYRELAAERLADYFNWRISGGFEPENGDENFKNLVMSLGDVADTLSEALSHPN